MAEYDVLFDDKVEQAACCILLSFPTFNIDKQEAKQLARLVLLTAMRVEEDNGK